MGTSFSDTISTRSNRSASPDPATLASWWNRSPLVTMMSRRPVARHLVDHLLDAVEQLDRVVEQALAQVEDRADLVRPVTRPSVSVMAVSMSDSVNALDP